MTITRLLMLCAICCAASCGRQQSSPSTLAPTDTTKIVFSAHIEMLGEAGAVLSRGQVTLRASGGGEWVMSLAPEELRLPLGEGRLKWERHENGERNVHLQPFVSDNNIVMTLSDERSGRWEFQTYYGIEMTGMVRATMGGDR
ncbi:MAG: hypothetical protein KDA16_12195 [Phycisphaerales bacterium]|nr:hypothetical protein [Phycisphaerales bacterium]